MSALCGRITGVESVEEDSRLSPLLREGSARCEDLVVGLTEDHLGAALIRHGDSVIII